MNPEPTFAERRIAFAQKADTTLARLCEEGAKLDGILQTVDPHSVTPEFFADVQSLSDEFEEYHRRMVATQREFAAILIDEARLIEEERARMARAAQPRPSPFVGLIWLAIVLALLVMLIRS